MKNVENYKETSLRYLILEECFSFFLVI